MSLGALTLTVLLLLHPLYLQLTLILLLLSIFSAGYANSENHVRHKDPLEGVSAADFLNPIYYSLQPEPDVPPGGSTPGGSKERTIAQYREMLAELDTLLRTLEEIRVRARDVLTWRETGVSRGWLIQMCVMVMLPAFLPLNHVALYGVVYLFCCNYGFYFSLTMWLLGLFLSLTGKRGKVDMPAAAASLPPLPIISETSDSASEFCDIDSSSGDEGAQELLECGRCARSVRALKCGFCGSRYCGACCSSQVTRERLGVTNPDTKHHLVPVCTDCFQLVQH